MFKFQHPTGDGDGDSEEDESSTFHVPTSDAEAPVVDLLMVNGALEPCGSLPKQQKDVFWQTEKMSRILNGYMTPMERVALQSLHVNSLEGVKDSDVQKVVKHFGTLKGCNTTCRRLIRALCKEKEFLPGEVVAPNVVLFTLMKHLLLSDRKFTPPLDEEVGKIIGCSCCSRTYFMPMGCEHKQVKLYNQTWLTSSLCSKCSRCLRCHRFLGCTLVWKGSKQVLQRVQYCQTMNDRSIL